MLSWERLKCYSTVTVTNDGNPLPDTPKLCSLHNALWPRYYDILNELSIDSPLCTIPKFMAEPFQISITSRQH